VHVDIALYDGDNEPLTRNGNPIVESLDVNGFAFYEIAWQSDRIMNAVLTTRTAQVSPPAPAAELYAVAFSGFRLGGSPEAIIPRREAAGDLEMTDEMLEAVLAEISEEIVQ
jgi:hypothetical protein